MKFFSFLIIFCSVLFSATIDTKLYDEKQRDAYYVEISKQIEPTQTEETLLLSKLREASSKKVFIEKYDLKKLDSKSISAEHFYDIVVTLSTFQNRVDENDKVLKSVYAQIIYFKQAIENLLEKDKSKLLSFQLQFAYYKVQQNKIEEKNRLLRDEIKRIKQSLFESIDKLKVLDEKELQEKLLKIQAASLKQKNEIVLEKLEKAKEALHESEEFSKVNKKVETLESAYQATLTQNIQLSMIHSLSSLQMKNGSKFYNSMGEIQEMIKNISDKTQQSLFLNQVATLKEISKNELGNTKLLFGATLEETKSVASQIKEFVVSPLFVFNEQAISMLNLFMALVYVVLGFFLGSFYKKKIARVSSRFENISMMSVRLMSNIGYYLIVLIFIMISISSLGINLTSLSLIAGALSIGIGFGLQTVVSNLIAGLIMMFERTIRIGDIIEINNVLTGVVTDMRIRSTTVKTFDNIDIIVPNSSFIQNNVINMTLEDRVRRLHIPFGVAYGTEIEDVRAAVLGALAKSELFYIRDDADRSASVRMTLMNSSSVDLELVVWVERDIKMKYVSIDSDFLILIYNALRANNISIPFPQLDVNMKEVLEHSSKG